MPPKAGLRGEVINECARILTDEHDAQKALKHMMRYRKGRQTEDGVAYMVGEDVEPSDEDVLEQGQGWNSMMVEVRKKCWTNESNRDPEYREKMLDVALRLESAEHREKLMTFLEWPYSKQHSEHYKASKPMSVAFFPGNIDATRLFIDTPVDAPWMLAFQRPAGIKRGMEEASARNTKQKVQEPKMMSALRYEKILEQLEKSIPETEYILADYKGRNKVHDFNRMVYTLYAALQVVTGRRPQCLNPSRDNPLTYRDGGIGEYSLIVANLSKEAIVEGAEADEHLIPTLIPAATVIKGLDLLQSTTLMGEANNKEGKPPKKAGPTGKQRKECLIDWFGTDDYDYIRGLYAEACVRYRKKHGLFSSYVDQELKRVVLCHKNWDIGRHYAVSLVDDNEIVAEGAM